MIPFVVGALVGAVAVLAVNNNDKIKKEVFNSAKKLKDVALDGVSKIKEKSQDLKKSTTTEIDTSIKEDLEVKNNG